MTIVGLTGSIGSGKTTFADFLASNSENAAHWETWQIVAEVATALRQASPKHPSSDDIEAINNWLEPLPRIIDDIFGKQVDFQQLKLTDERLRESPENFDKLLLYLRLIQTQPELQDQAITEHTRETFRSILQWLGGYLVKTVGNGIWYDEIIKRIQGTDNLKLAIVGGVRFPGDARRIKTAGGSILEISRPGLATQDSQDITERERSLIVPDSVISNDAGLDEFANCATQVASDLFSDELKPNYSAEKHKH